MIRAWIDKELLPPVVDWIMVEDMPRTARALQARAVRARQVGEIDDHVCNFLMMQTASVLRFVWAEGVGHHLSSWIDPNGVANTFPYEVGHSEWIRENAARLKADGLITDESEAEGAAATVSIRMLRKGWIKYSGGMVIGYQKPTPEQVEAISDLLSQFDPPEDQEISVFLSSVATGVIPVRRIKEVGFARALEEMISQAKSIPTEVPLSLHKKSDAGGGMNGPFGQGDGQDVNSSFMSNVQDGSTAPFDKSYSYLAQDWNPETWWAKSLLQYLKKNFPGKKDVSGPEPDSGSIPSATGPGQQFAHQVRKITHLADATDPSDTDGQHGQLETTMETRLVDPQSILYKREKGRGGPAGNPGGSGDGELKTRLGDRWRQRRSDKAVEREIVHMEKQLMEPGQIVQELKTEGVPEKVIDETYENRDRNLFKVVEVGS